MLRLPAEQLRAELLKFAKDEKGVANIKALKFHNRRARRKWTRILLNLHKQMAQHRFLLQQAANKARHGMLAIKRRERKEAQAQQQAEGERILEAEKQEHNERILLERAQQQENHGEAEEVEPDPHPEDSR